jgi:dienelactone hydrolase
MIRLLALFLLVIWAGGARADEPSPWVRFTSLDADKTVLDGYLFKAPGPGRHPAVVFLHGCGGLMVKGQVGRREQAWAATFNQAGETVLMVDSFTPRGVHKMCSPSTYQATVFKARPFDAYAALLYLQMQPDIDPQRIGLMGWSEGGGALLATIAENSPARPAYLAQGDFRAAVAFYPARCNLRAHGPWVSHIPLLVLNGLLDVWTPAEPCRDLLNSAAASHSRADIVIYPNAVHDFDSPGMHVVRRPDYTTRTGIVPIMGEDPAAHADALQRVPAFLAANLAP